MSIRQKLERLNFHIQSKVFSGKVPSGTGALAQTFHPDRHGFVRQSLRILKKCGFDEIILTNNNPDATLVGEEFDGIKVINQSTASLPMTRLQLALKSHCQRFVALDDDILLTSKQIAQLTIESQKSPRSPIGITGTIITPDTLIHHVIGRPVHTIHSGYFFSKEVLERFWELHKIISNDRVLSNLYYPYTDDIILSFSGTTWPRSLDVGHFLVHSTSNAQAIAVSNKTKFHSKRLRFLMALSQYLGWSLNTVRPPSNFSSFPLTERSPTTAGLSL